MATVTEVDKDIEELLRSVEKKERPFKVVLYNDDTHEMLEVVEQIALAVPCDVAKATELMLQAHKHGRACVKTGSKEACEKTKKILEDIQLKVTMEEA